MKLFLLRFSQRSSSEAQSRSAGLCELAGSPGGPDPGGGLSDQPLVPDVLPLGPSPPLSFNRGGHAVGQAHRKNPLAQEAGAGLWSSSKLAWWVCPDFT